MVTLNVYTINDQLLYEHFIYKVLNQATKQHLTIRQLFKIINRKVVSFHIDKQPNSLPIIVLYMKGYSHAWVHTPHTKFFQVILPSLKQIKCGKNLKSLFFFLSISSNVKLKLVFYCNIRFSATTLPSSVHTKQDSQHSGPKNTTCVSGHFKLCAADRRIKRERKTEQGVESHCWPMRGECETTSFGLWFPPARFLNIALFFLVFFFFSWIIY